MELCLIIMAILLIDEAIKKRRAEKYANKQMAIRAALDKRAGR